MRQTAVVLTHGRFRTSDAKTAHGLVRGPSRYRILGVIDGECAGQDAGAALDGTARGIPVFATLDTLIAARGQPEVCIVGIATHGGFLPPDFRGVLIDAARRGISLVSGLHSFLAEDHEIASAAAATGAAIVDVRRPKARGELSFWSGQIRSVRAPRVAVLGTDCALGKRTTAQTLIAACRAQGLRAELVYTGQTGWLQGGKHGFILDSTINDFVSGEIERAVVACDREERPDLIFLEGQSALRNPAGPCGAELLVSAEARGVILQHAPTRQFFDEQESLGNRIPSLASEIRLIGLYGARVLAIALNHEQVAEADRELVRRRVEQETALPAFFPLLDDAAPVVTLLRGYLGEAIAGDTR
jgi:uncharacterized NAD-dependent epimerase/dehydratase family protein